MVACFITHFTATVYCVETLSSSFFLKTHLILWCHFLTVPEDTRESDIQGRRECWRTDGVIGRSRGEWGGKEKPGQSSEMKKKSGGIRQQSKRQSSFHTICLSTGCKCFVPHQKKKYIMEIIISTLHSFHNSTIMQQLPDENK